MLYTEADLDMEYNVGYRKGYDDGYDEGYYTAYIYYIFALSSLRAKLEEKEKEIERLKNK